MSTHDDEILGRAYDSRLMRRLLGYLRPYTARVLLALGAIVAGVAFQLAQPVLVKRAIDLHIGTGDLAGVGRVALLYLGTLAGAFVAEFVQTATLQMLGQRIMYDLRRQVYDHLQRLDLAYYDRHPVGRLMTRVTSDVDAINDLFTSGVVSVFGDVLSLLGIVVILLSLDWRLALLTFCVLPLILMVTQWFRRNVRDSYREVRTLVSRLNAFLQENLTGMTTVQLFRRESRAFADFDSVNSEHRDANLRSIYYYAVFYPVIELIGALSTALILWYGGGWVLAGTLTIGTLVAFTQYAQRFFRPISDMSEKFNLLQAAMASSERLFGLVDTPISITDGAGLGEPALPAMARAGLGKPALPAMARAGLGKPALPAMARAGLGKPASDGASRARRAGPTNDGASRARRAGPTHDGASRARKAGPNARIGGPTVSDDGPTASPGRAGCPEPGPRATPGLPRRSRRRSITRLRRRRVVSSWTTCPLPMPRAWTS